MDRGREPIINHYISYLLSSDLATYSEPASAMLGGGALKGHIKKQLELAQIGV